MSTMVDNLELEPLKCLISFCLEVYYFLMAKINFFKFEWSKKKSLGLLCEDTRRDLDVYTYTAQWKALLYLNELNQKHLCQLLRSRTICSSWTSHMSVMIFKFGLSSLHIYLYVYITLYMPRDHLHWWICYYIWFRLFNLYIWANTKFKCKSLYKFLPSQ